MDDIRARIEHTYLRPDGGPREIARLCAEAREHGLFAVCVNPGYVGQARAELAGSGVAVVTVAGFPLGAAATRVKAFEAAQAAWDGAHEVDMVIDIGRLREGDLRAVERNIGAVVQAAGVPVKVILECCYLSPEQIRAGCLAAAAAGAAFVKTSTGFGPGGATVDDLRLMREVVGPNLGIKAAGGIRTLADARRFVAAGADRIGTSAGAAIARELLRS